MEFHKGAAMTAKEEGLWDPCGNVTREEIWHMQARVEVHRATHEVGDNPDDFLVSPACAPSWCRWIVVDSMAYATRPGPRLLPSAAFLQPKALPPLPSTSPDNSRTRGTSVLTREQMALIAKKKSEASQRKLNKSRQSSRGLSVEQAAEISRKKEEAQRRKLAKQGGLKNQKRSSGVLSAEQIASISQKKAEAQQRRFKKQAGQMARLPQVPSDDEDPFGFGPSY